MKGLNLIIYFFSEVFSKASFMLLLPLFGYYLSVSDYGVVSLYLPIFMYLAPVFGLGLQSSQMRFYFSKGISQDMLMTNVVTLWALCLIFFGLLFFLYAHFYLVHNLIYHYSVIIKSFIALASSSFVVIGIDLYRARNRPLNFAIANGLYRALIVLFIFCAFLFFNRNLDSVINSFMIVGAVFFVFFFSLYAKSFYLSMIDKRLMVKLLRYGIPIAMVSVTQYIISIGGRYIILHRLNSLKLGYYAMAVSVTQVVYLINAVFSKAWVPDLFSNLSAQAVESKRNYVAKVSLIYTVLVCFIILAFKPIAQLIFQYFDSGKYLPSLPLVPILLISYVFEVPYTVSIDRLYYMKKTTLILVVFALAGMMFVALTYGLLSLDFGYYAPCWAAVIVQIFLGLTVYFLAGYYDGIRLGFGPICSICLCTILLLLITIVYQLLLVAIFVVLFYVFFVLVTLQKNKLSLKS
jgi:O-antigen/teichoic acid export membrane protein